MTDRSGGVVTATLLLCCLAALPGTARAAAGEAADPGLEIFKTWLAHEHPGYGCDEGPARFRNEAVEAAYAGGRFYYVLTYTRGIQPPFKNALSLVARVDASGDVRPLNPYAPETYQAGLMEVTRAEQARRAAAAVLVLAMGDPGERRWKFRTDQITARRSRKGWVCTYQHGDENHTSQVTFDRDGRLAAIATNPPPVP